MTAKPLVEIQNLYVYFDTAKTQAGLKGVTMSVPKGEITALIGASGSGKSITSLALMGLLPKTCVQEGSILFEGKNLLLQSEEEWQAIRGKEIAMIFQEPMSALNPLISCGEQITECILAHQHISKTEAKSLALGWMEKVKIPEPEQAFYKYPHEMSGGQKQRIMIAMAMVNAPKLLIADEPSTALDVLVQKEIIQLLRDLQHTHGTTILFITHDLGLAQLIATRFIEMKDGKVIDRTLEKRNVVLKSPVEQHKTVLLDVKKVAVTYQKNKQKTQAVQGVSFQIHEGETLGLIGASGCGKTTLSKAILGLEKVSAGAIFFKGKDLSKISKAEWRALRKDIQIIYQDPFAALNPRLKIGKAIQEGLEVHYNINPKEAKKEVEHWLELVQLQASDYDKYPHEFSGGQRQRICIARALILSPSLVICDESVAALDVYVQEQILDLLIQLQQQKKLTYLFITHDINVVKKICDRVLVMQAGKIVESGALEQVVLHAQHDYTQALIDAVP